MAAIDNDSDNDVVTDFLNSNCTPDTDPTHTKEPNLCIGNIVQNSNRNLLVNQTRPSCESQNYCIPVINAPPLLLANNTNNNNMIPTINVTPHSPASITKYNNIFEDTLSQLQNIRETVVQMKNSSAHMHDGFTSFWPVHAAILSVSLPDLSAASINASGTHNVGQFLRWMPQQQQYVAMNERRRSWTTIDDLNVTNKSVSLSSLDSEEPETICATEQRRRSARNSTGGISTHSLNEAELARDFQRIATKRNLATEIRIPLQKSISTSSIVAKEEIKARHLYDSEDENQSLLRAHAKIESYDNVEKRRKRGSLFFRKKKDKSKMKICSQNGTCEACGANIMATNIKEHQMECKGKKSNSVSGQKVLLVGVKKGAEKADGGGQDYYDGVDQAGNYNDDTPLIRSEFLNDPPIEAQDLGADPILGIAAEEHDSWSPSVPKEVLKSLKEKQIKRQEHIYEFIMTEKHHCQTLLVMQKVFVESLERHFPSLNINNMFPRLSELTELHISFLKKLRQKQREQYVVESIADILLDFFSLEKAQHLRLAYGEFCANHRTALEHFKACMTSRDQTFAEWYKHCLANPLLKKKGIPECILFVTQRLTKYPLLIEPLLKSAREEKLETDKLQHALNLVKALLIDVDACVAEKELRERQIDIFNRVDPKSFAIYKNKPFRKSDIGVESRRRLKFEGLATLMQGRSKMQLVLVVVLTDCLCFLSENSAHNKYTFFTPEHKAGVVPLQKLLIREKAGTEARGIYIISSNPSFPEMYELKVQQPKDKNTWIQSIRQAVLECPSSDVIETEDLTAEEKLRIGVSKRDLIDKIRQKDIDHAILLEDKIFLQLNLLKEQTHFSEVSVTSGPNNSSASIGGNGGYANGNAANASNFLATFGSYKDLVGVDCNTAELWKYVLNMVQGISQLAAMVYTASTGLPVSRSVSSVGEKQSDNYASPTLPKRAETFAGFDEKRAKNSFPCRDVAKISTLQALTPRLQELEEKRDSKAATPLVTLKIQSATTETQSTNAPDHDECMMKEHNYATLQISHHLHTLLCIVSQQMTTIHSLQLQLALYRESPRVAYTHNDQLEELRNLQDKLQEEKTAWLRQKELQEQELDEKRSQQIKLQEQIKAEQEDIKQQREQLYRKMELLSNQGLLLSPNTPLLINSSSLPVVVAASGSDDAHDSHEGLHIQMDMPTPTTLTPSTVDRRKDKWRTSSTISKTPPGNLLSATNAPKINQICVKQQIPMKLSSLSSNTTVSTTSCSGKIDKSASFNTSTLQQNNCTQILPLKLADKRMSTSNFNASQTVSHIVPQHARTGSSPAIIQHPNTATTTSPPPPTVGVTRTDSSSTFTFGQRQNNAATATPISSRTLQTLTAAGKSSLSSTGATLSNLRSGNVNVKPDEEEIYF